MKTITTDNNPYLLIAGTDRPQRDAEGAPIANPNFGQVTETDVADPPAPPHAEDALTFKRRFTTAERIAVRNAAKTDGIVADFMDLLDTGAAVNSPVRFNDPDVIAGLNYLETASVIAAGRAAQILTP